jgi:hypothetical protein
MGARHFIFFCFIVNLTLPVFAQKEKLATCENCYGYYYSVVNDFLIIASKKNYLEAEKIAKDCAKKLNIPFRSRGAILDTARNKIDYPNDTCITLGLSGQFPCEIVRGMRGITAEQKDNGIYLTIEPTFEYANLTRGLFIVVLGSGNPGDQSLRTWLKKAKKEYPSSYIKTVVLFGDGCGQ